MRYDININSYIGYPISRQWVQAQLAQKGDKPVTVRINSYGGDTNTALDIRQQFIDHGNVTVHFVGMSASAATILAMGAKHITMSRHALLLIHQCMTPVIKWKHMNKEEIAQFVKELQAQAEDQGKVDQVIANIYAERTGTNLATIQKTMSEAHWLTAEECLNLGLVDAITEDGEEEPLTESTLSQFQACGLPIPVRTAATFHTLAKPTFAERISAFFNWLFDADWTDDEDESETPRKPLRTSAPQASADGPDDDEEEDEDEDDAGMQTKAQKLSDAQARIQQLESELQALREADGADTTQIEGSTQEDGQTVSSRYSRAIESYQSIKKLL